ncbi:MAG: endonuclease MutS2 [Oscillospiraceae bacterium]|nr:endonuclease MutS2 [Oscillospiraceae bacterium]
MKKNILTLEFDKILNLLKSEATCQETKKYIDNITPFWDYKKIKQELNKTDDMFKLITSFGLPKLNFSSSLDSIINKIKIKAQLTLKELLLVSSFLSQIKELLSWKRTTENKVTEIDYLFENLIFIKDLKSRIDKVVLSEDEIVDDASENLFIIRKKIKNVSSKARDSLEKLIKSSVYQKYLQEQIITIRDGRFVVPVKSEYRSEIKGLVHDSSASGSTLFIEPISVVEANNQIKILERQELEEINKILDELSGQVNLNITEIIKNYNLLIKIDLYLAKARLGQKMAGTIPKINNQKKINLIKARHPLIESQKVVPIDINLGYDFDKLIITGPNTGGKTVALKTVGLLTVMGMSGLMIPAEDSSEISIFNKILVDIGDEQSIEHNLSTFSAHMTNIIDILKKSDQDTLVLIDELGSGTDPVEGASLAVAILEEFDLKKSKVIATTHYPEIKLYALNTNRVENASCEFDINTLRPTYKLSIGIPGKSNAFLISKKLGLSENILNKAKSLMTDEKNKFEDVVSNLESLKIQSENKRDELDKLEKQIKIERDNISKIKSQLEKNKNSEIEKAKQEAQKIILDVRTKSQLILEELDNILKQKDSENFYKMAVDIKSKIKSKFKNLEDIADPVSLRNNNFDKILSDKKIENGDEVKVLDINQVGVVISDKDKDGCYFVQIGIIKKKEHFSNLVAVKSSKNKQRVVVTKNIKSKFSGKIESEIHLRGKTVEEAILELDKFIDDAVVAGLCVVRVVHGKGTGVLRQAVSDYLRSNKSVADFRLGTYGEGESGVTIVSLK